MPPQDGRSPFNPQEEEAILILLRQKKLWPCFPPHLGVGRMGFRSKGFHERQALLGKNRKPPAAAAAAATTPQQQQQVSVFDRYQVLAKSLSNLQVSFAWFGLDVSEFVFNAMRFTIAPLYYMTKPCVNPARVQSLLESNVTPEEFAIVFEFQSSDQLIWGQNARAIHMFGDSRGRFCGQVLKQVDTVKLTLAIGGAYSYPSQDISIPNLPINNTLHLARMRLEPDANLMLFAGRRM